MQPSAHMATASVAHGLLAQACIHLAMPNPNRNPNPTPTPTPTPNQAVALEMPHCARGWMQRAAEERALAARPPGMLPATRTALVVD